MASDEPDQPQKPKSSASEATALSNLADTSADAATETEPTETGGATGSKKFDKETAAAVNAALSQLSLSERPDTLVSKNDSTGKPKEANKSTVENKKIKIDQSDVTFLVEELDISKTKASDILRNAGGSRAEALRHFVVHA